MKHHNAARMMRTRHRTTNGLARCQGRTVAYLAILNQAGTLYRVGTLPRALSHFDTEDQV